MDARAVRAFLETLPERTDDRAAERVRFFLEALQRPDLRCLVAPIVGGSAGRIAAVCAAILEAAGASTGRLDGGAATVAGAPLDDPLLERAGTLAAAATYQLGASRPDLGEPSRQEVDLVLALVAFGEANMRVALLVDDVMDRADTARGAAPDLVVAGTIASGQVDGVLALASRGKPLVAAPQEPPTRERLEAGAAALAVPLLLGGRDFWHEDRGGETDVHVAGERYPGLPRAAGASGWEVGTGVAAALGLGVLGVRMRPEWVVVGAEAAATATMKG